MAVLIRHKTALLEWLLWLVLSIWLYLETSRFDTLIAEYAFGATGWPRALCLLLFLGATGQMLTRVFSQSTENATQSLDAGDESDGNERANEETTSTTGLSRNAKIAGYSFFIVPLVYLYLLQTLGFYLLTPFFIAALLLLLGVRQLKPLLGVIFVVYFLILLIFTRLFYVALPVGTGWAYDINNAIVALVRLGV